MSKKVVPPSASNTDGKASKIPKAINVDYTKQKPAWRIGHFDYKSKWGLNQLGTFTFVFGEKLSRYFLYLYPSGCIIGAVSSTRFAWDIAAFFIGLMLLINLPMLILLSDKALIFLKKRNKDVRKQSTFNK